MSFAVAPEIQFRTLGATRRVSGGRKFTVLPLPLTREYGHASLKVNVDVCISSGEQRYFGSFAVRRRVSDNRALLGELDGNDLSAADERRVLCNVSLLRKILGNPSVNNAIDGIRAAYLTTN